MEKNILKKPPLKRIPYYYTGRKATLTEEELVKLWTHNHIIEEKYDGTLTTKKYGDLLLMLEDMKYVHSVYYHNLISRYYLVDVIDISNNLRLNWKERNKISIETGYPMPRLLLDSISLTKSIMKTRLDLWVKECLPVSKKSSYFMEGFVIKSEKYMDLGAKYSVLDLAGAKRYPRAKKNKIIGWEKYYCGEY